MEVDFLTLSKRQGESQIVYSLSMLLKFLIGRSCTEYFIKMLNKLWYVLVKRYKSKTFKQLYQILIFNNYKSNYRTGEQSISTLQSSYWSHRKYIDSKRSQIDNKLALIGKQNHQNNVQVSHREWNEARDFEKEHFSISLFLIECRIPRIFFSASQLARHC